MNPRRIGLASLLSSWVAQWSSRTGAHAEDNAQAEDESARSQEDRVRTITLADFSNTPANQAALRVPREPVRKYCLAQSNQPVTIPPALPRVTLSTRLGGGVEMWTHPIPNLKTLRDAKSNAMLFRGANCHPGCPCVALVIVCNSHSLPNYWVGHAGRT
jgi:hypothetical protein